MSRVNYSRRSMAARPPLQRGGRKLAVPILVEGGRRMRGRGVLVIDEGISRFVVA